MAQADDLKQLQDDTMKAGVFQNAIWDALGARLDVPEADIESAAKARMPLVTDRPEALRAMFGIEADITGATLGTEIDERTNLGFDNLQAGVERVLDENYDFSVSGGSSVTVYHHSTFDARWDNTENLSVVIPSVDDAGTVIPLDDQYVVDEIRRVALMGRFSVSYGVQSRSGPYIKVVETDDGAENIEIAYLLPDEIQASSEGKYLADRKTYDIEWFDETPALRRADMQIDSEDEDRVENVSSVLLKASSTYADDYRQIEEEITIDTKLLGGFDSPEPNPSNVGITGIFAKEKTVSISYDIEDRKISGGNLPTVNLLEPWEQIPFKYTQDFQLIDSPRQDKYPTGTEKIFHQYLTSDSSFLQSLAGRTARVFAAPIGGGDDNDTNLAVNPVLVFEDWVQADTDRTPTSGQLLVEFQREFFDGPSDRKIDLKENLIEQDQELEFNITFSGETGPSQYGHSSGHAPGLAVVPLLNPTQTTGVGQISGFPNMVGNGERFIKIHAMDANTEGVTVTIGNIGGGGPLNPGRRYTPQIVPFTQRPTFGGYPDQGECRSIGLTVPDFFQMINFPPTSDDPAQIDSWWSVTFKVRVLYDLYERTDADKQTQAGNPDRQFKDFSGMDSNYRVSGVTLSGHNKFRIDEYKFIEPEPGWTGYTTDVDDDQTVTNWRLEYDKNLVPLEGQVVRAKAHYDILPEDGQGTENISIPVPDGMICDYVNVYFGTQYIKVSITDVSQIRSHIGGPVFKTVRLNTVVDAEKSGEESIASVVVLYQKGSVEEDTIVRGEAHYEKAANGLVAVDIEDLKSISFSINGELPVTNWSHNLGTAVYATFFTEKDTGDLIQSPINKHVTGGTIFFFAEKLNDAGVFGDVRVTYGDLASGTLAQAKDIQILSVSVPEGRVDYFIISKITNYKLWYRTKRGFLQDYIGNNRIQTVEVHFDKNQIPKSGWFVEVWAHYVEPGLLYNGADETISFSATSDLLMEDAEISGLTLKKKYFDTIEEGIIEGVLPRALHVNRVIGIYNGFALAQEKNYVEFRPTYDLPLKEVIYPVREDFVVDSVTVNGVTPRRVELDTEFDGLVDYNYGGVSPYRPQRIRSVRVLFYDQNLAQETGESLATTIGVREIIGKRISPFIDGGKWFSPSGLDEPYMVEMQGLTINRVTVDGVTTTPKPITVNAQGFEEPFENGNFYEPRYMIFNYSQINRIRMYLDVNKPIYYHNKNHVFFDDDKYWKSEARSVDEQLDFQANSSYSLNQVLVVLTDTSMVPDRIRIRLREDAGEWLQGAYVPLSTTVDDVDGAQIGDELLKLGSTTGMVPYTVIQVGDGFTRVKEILLDGKTIRTDPLQAPATYGSTVSVVGWDFGDEFVNTQRIVVDFIKGGTHGSIEVQQVLMRGDRRFYERALARNVLFANDEAWASEGQDSEDGEAWIRMMFDVPPAINTIELDTDGEYKIDGRYVDAENDEERPFFLSRKDQLRRSIYTSEDAVDDGRFGANTIRPKSLELKITKLRRDPNTGDYRAMFRRLTPCFYRNTYNSRTAFMLDNDIRTAWMSRDASDISTVVSIVMDLENGLYNDRLGLITAAQGTSMDLYGSLGDNAEGFQLLDSVPDITAANPADVVTQSLTASAGVSQPSPDELAVTDGSQFDIGAYVRVYDDDGDEEYRAILGIVGNTLTLDVNLGLDYEFPAKNPAVEQSNVLVPPAQFPFAMNGVSLGGTVYGPRTFLQARTITGNENRLLRADFYNIPDNGNGERRLDIRGLDVFRAITVS